MLVLSRYVTCGFVQSMFGFCFHCFKVCHELFYGFICVSQQIYDVWEYVLGLLRSIYVGLDQFV